MKKAARKRKELQSDLVLNDNSPRPDLRAATAPLTVEGLFGIDYRSLAAFRISVGFITLFDLLRRSLDFTAHYTQFGVLSPTSHLFHATTISAVTHLYGLFGGWGWAAFLMTVSVVSSLFVTFGLFTRVSWALSWILVLSIQNHNVLVTNGGDLVLRLLYFWGLFLPLGEKYAVDTLLRKDAGKESGPLFFSVGTLGLMLQIGFIYFFAAVLKSGPDWHADGTAVFYSLYLDKYATGLAVWLRQYPLFLHWLTPAVWYFELLAPCFLFVPFLFPFFRLGAVLGLMGMHLAFFGFLRIGTFPWICIAGLTIFLPSLFWDKLAGPVRRYRPLERWFAVAERQRFRWTGRVFFSCRRFFSAFSGVLTPRVRRVIHVVAQCLAGASLVIALLWNLGGLPESGITLPGPIASPARLVGLDQKWDMFAPRPTRDDGWMVIPGQLENGKAVDVWYLDPSPVNWAKPKQLLAYNYRSERWIKYFENLILSAYAPRRVDFANYLCRQWNYTFPVSERLKSVSVYYMSNPTLPTGKGTAKAMLLIQQNCPR